MEQKIGAGRRSEFKNKLLIILFVLFLAGVLYGSLTAATAPVNIIEKLAGITGGFADKRAEQSLFTTFINSFGANMLIIAVVFVLGFGAVFQPIELFVPLFYGLGLGISMGYIYKTQLFQGVVYCAVLVVPHTVVALIAIILAVRESFLLSNLFLGCVVERFSGELSVQTVKLYSVKALILSAIVLISAIADCLLTFIFARLFVT